MHGPNALVPLLAAALVACGSATARQPPGTPPSAESVTREQPGGDAAHPHGAALERALGGPWGARNDKDDQLHVPLPDSGHWKRVRFWGVDHFTGFRYGDDHHLVAIVFVLDVPKGSPHTSRLCMRRFEDWARPQLKNYDVKLGSISESAFPWRTSEVAVHQMDGRVNTGFSETDFSAAWAAYAAYEDACLIYAVAVPWEKDRLLAQKVRDRFAAEAFTRVDPRTPSRPYRK
jgi:hypothetical protein